MDKRICNSQKKNKQTHRDRHTILHYALTELIYIENYDGLHILRINSWK